MFTGRRSDGGRDQGQRPGVPVDDECLLAAGLTEDEIKANALVFLLAGYDTTSTVMSFTLFMLAAHKDVLQAQAEIDDKVGQVGCCRCRRRCFYFIFLNLLLPSISLWGV